MSGNIVVKGENSVVETVWFSIKGVQDVTFVETRKRCSPLPSQISLAFFPQCCQNT